ncbi:DMT family transporter [Parasporobacterium paucivorans]|uniref:Permease of the drug/metabolite transporter (DMT) superfamily n=1 Tax=Parasporobacterium paucivorans DSM 15970 TaxID=1122934 RepID=A0A1M6AIB0_9FIRM|nr:DMT family transporter [Parasporobacterium paucivorans]SHI36240.1 Permease of the drug/metabolite transporter (DMT) superfamily [Parasporobacterium paucivorans DSM 15970]
MKSEKNIKIGARLSLFAAALIWGSSFFIMKNTTEVLPSNYLLSIRFTVACIFLCIVFRKKLPGINAEYIRGTLVIGAFLFVAYFTQTIGITGTTPGKNAFLTSIYCVMVPFLFWFVRKKRPEMSNFIAAVLCLGGIGLVSLTEGLRIGFGDAFTIIGGFFYAAHMVAVAVFGKNRDPVLITILQFAYCSVFSWITTFIFEDIPPVSVWSGGLVLDMVYLAFFATAIALLLQNIGQKYTNPSAASIILSLESVFGVLFSVMLYGESVTPKLLGGFLLIFISIVISETKISFPVLKYVRSKAEEADG